MNAGGPSSAQGGPPPPPPPPLDEAFDAAWFGCSTADAAGRSIPEQQTSGLPERATGNGFLSWLFPWRGGAAAAKSERRGRRQAGRPVGQRARAEGPTRLPRPQSTPKLHKPLAAPAGSSGQQTPVAPAAGADTAAPAQQPQPLQPAQPPLTAQQQTAAADTRRRAARAAAKQANYAERRQAWRQRIEAIKSKQASRQAAAAVAPGPGGAEGPRVYSKHVAIPVAPGATGSRAGSTQATPHGSPKRHEPLLDAAGAALPLLEAPPVWQGFQTAEPPDPAAATPEQLMRFLQQAGWPAEAVLALPDQEALVAAARSARGTWEVERIILACTWPEEVLRVPRKCGDAAALKAAYRRVSMSVHPDKCSAVGASDAMSIVADCYGTLLASALEGKATKAVPAFLRARAASSSSNLAGAAAAAGAPPAPAAASAQPQPQQEARGQQAEEGQQQRQVPPPLPRPPAWHSRPASAEPFLADATHAQSWEALQPRQQQAETSPARPASAQGEECAPMPEQHHRGGSSSSLDHWNPHGQLSSEEQEAAAAAAAAWEQATGGWPPAAMRSRSSSAGSLAATGAALPQAAPPSRASSASLASSGTPGGSQHGGALGQGVLQRQGSAAAPPSPQAPNGSGMHTAPLPAAGSPGPPPPTGAATSPQQAQPPPDGSRPAASPRPASAGAGPGAAAPKPKPGGAAAGVASGQPQKQKVRVTLRVRQG